MELSREPAGTDARPNPRRQHRAFDRQFYFNPSVMILPEFRGRPGTSWGWSDFARQPRDRHSWPATMRETAMIGMANTTPEPPLRR